MNRTRKTIAALIVTGAAGLGVIGCGSSSGETTTQAAATQQQSATGQPQAGGAPRGGPAALTTAQLTTAAKQLDTTAAKLKTAITAAEGERGTPGGTPGASGSGSGSGSSGQRPTGDPRTALYSAVAKTLGTTKAKVEAALAGVLPSPPSGRQGGTPPSGQGARRRTARAGRRRVVRRPAARGRPHPPDSPAATAAARPRPGPPPERDRGRRAGRRARRRGWS